MMEHEAGEEQEEEQTGAAEPSERPSLTERLLGVTTIEDELNAVYTSTSARGLIERLTNADRRLSERRPVQEPKPRAHEEEQSPKAAAQPSVEQIPEGLRATDPVFETPANTTSGHDSPPVVEGPAPISEEPAAAPRRPIVNNLPPIYEKRPVVDLPAQVAEDDLPGLDPPAPVIGESRPAAASQAAPTPEAAADSTSVASDPLIPQPDPAPRLDIPYVPAPEELARMPLRVGPGPLESSRNEANNFIRLRYYVLLASVAFVFGLAIVSGVAMVVALAADAEWQVLAITGSLEATALVSLVAILVFLQNEPSVHHAPTPTEIAQLETARAYLNKSFEFWEKYLNEREDNRPVTAEDVAMAVSSLTAASHSLLDLESGLATMSGKPREATRDPQPPVPGATTRPTVRARPSRY